MGLRFLGPPLTSAGAGDFFLRERPTFGVVPHRIKAAVLLQAFDFATRKDARFGLDVAIETLLECPASVRSPPQRNRRFAQGWVNPGNSEPAADDLVQQIT
jgi:hypothetical protein